MPQRKRPYINDIRPFPLSFPSTAAYIRSFPSGPRTGPPVSLRIEGRLSMHGAVRRNIRPASV
ncbi:hypothetical protein HMPREF3293_01839 [Christensenella minuta]|uniref:Uncharacterized protein n=1 Tax=Christensenella minuta TaxID=626937 RepID=A0A136Q3I6_9FIRM|nr:hypothetical protein HMPREF3293_01839 [Christensenella minuta]